MLIGGGLPTDRDFEAAWRSPEAMAAFLDAYPNWSPRFNDEGKVTHLEHSQDLAMKVLRERGQIP